MVDFGNDWNDILADELTKEYYLNMRKILASEYRSRVIYPHMNDIFNAFRLTPFGSVKAVILGQDPYHGAGQAHGLCFSVKPPTVKPPSLVNIFKEIESDLGLTPPAHGDLTAWAREGVLLLNTVLTVREGQANSHANIGWQTFTDNVIKLLNERSRTIIFLLWGKNAKNKESFITNPEHKKLSAAHPSPLSAHNGFFGCRHFSGCNTLLKMNGIAPVNWEIN